MLYIAKRKVLSVETILSARVRTHPHTHPPTHEQADYTKLNVHNLKQIANRDLRPMKTAARDICSLL